MDSTLANHPRKGEFFLLEAGAISGPACGVVFENLDRLLSPPRMILLPEEGHSTAPRGSAIGFQFQRRRTATGSGAGIQRILAGLEATA